MTNDS